MIIQVGNKYFNSSDGLIRESDKISEAVALADRGGITAFEDSPAYALKCSEEERVWRDAQFIETDKEYIIRRRRGGDIAELDAYAEALCDWPESSDFPDKTKRPQL